MTQEGRISCSIPINRTGTRVNSEEPGTASDGTPRHPPRQGIGDNQSISNPRSPSDGVSKDVEHVMAVVSQSEGVDNSVVADDGE